MVIFNSYVKLPEGNPAMFQTTNQDILSPHFLLEIILGFQNPQFRWGPSLRSDRRNGDLKLWKKGISWHLLAFIWIDIDI
jgi:hypothetical protein